MRLYYKGIWISDNELKFSKHYRTGDENKCVSFIKLPDVQTWNVQDIVIISLSNTTALGPKFLRFKLYLVAS